MKTILEVKNLCKTYILNKRQNNVLKNVNFTITDGEMVAVMGPSGSGKSTLLYAVSGMDKITAGDVYFQEKILQIFLQRSLQVLGLMKWGLSSSRCICLKTCLYWIISFCRHASRKKILPAGKKSCSLGRI